MRVHRGTHRGAACGAALLPTALLSAQCCSAPSAAQCFLAPSARCRCLATPSPHGLRGALCVRAPIAAAPFVGGSLMCSPASATSACRDVCRTDTDLCVVLLAVCHVHDDVMGRHGSAPGEADQLWHVRHQDGDEEDLDRREMEEEQALRDGVQRFGEGRWAEINQCYR